MAESAGRHQYINTTWGPHLVAAYAGLNLHQVAQLDYGVYLQWLRDAYIYMLNGSEEGRAYLDDAWRMEQTEPDKDKLRIFAERGPRNGQ